MKRLFCLTTLFLTFAAGLSLLNAQSTRIMGTVPFKNNSEARFDWVAQGIEQILLDRLPVIKAVTVYEPETISRVLREMNIRDASVVDAKKAFSIGKATAIEVLFLGDYTVTSGQLTINTRMVSTYTGSSILEQTFTGPTSDIFRGMKGMIEKGLSTMQVPMSDTERAQLGEQPTESIAAFESYCRAYIEIKRQAPLEAIAGYFQKAVQEDNTYWEAQYNLGVIYYNFQLYDKALQQFNSVIEKSPRFYKPYFGKGVIYYLRRDYHGAVTQLRKSLKLALEHDRSYYYIGMAYTKIDSLKSAIQNLEKSIEINPHYAPAHYRLGLAEMQRGWFKKAITSHTAATRLNPSFYQANNALGEAYYSLNLYEEAIIEFNKAIKLKPDYATAHFNLGNSIYRRGALQEIVGSFWALIEVQYLPDGSNGGSPIAGLEDLRDKSRQTNSGEILQQMVRAYRTALTYDIRLYEGAYNLALTYENLGKLDSAEYFFKAAIAQKDDLSQAQMKLGKLYESQKKYDLALTQFKKVVAIEPDYFVSSPKLGEPYRYINIIETVLNEHQTRLDNNPRDVEALLVVGKIFLSLKRYGQAEEYYEQLVQLAPDDLIAKKTLHAIKKRLRKL